jgi:hypothetical protein
MRVIKSLFVAALFLGLANPAIAQTDPHHPEGGDTPSVEAGAPAGDAAQLAAPPTGSAMSRCPDMMGMMQQGGGAAMPMMQMHMMAMMQMHMQLMQQMQGGMGGMMQPQAGGSPQMQMMEMMRSMQMMQMDMIQMMQRMQKDVGAPGAPAEGATQ